MSLINATTSDRYTEAATVKAPGAVRWTLAIANASVVYQLGQGWPGPVWDTEERLLPPTIGSIERRCDAIRFRSATAGQPARVSADGLLPQQVNTDG